MSFLLAPFALFLSFVVVFLSISSRILAVLCAFVANVLSASLIKINSDRYANFIFIVVSIGELSGHINRSIEEGANEEKIQSK